MDYSPAIWSTHDRGCVISQATISHACLPALRTRDGYCSRFFAHTESRKKGYQYQKFWYQKFWYWYPFFLVNSCQPSTVCIQMKVTCPHKKCWDFRSSPTEGTVWIVWKSSGGILGCMPATLSGSPLSIKDHPIPDKLAWPLAQILSPIKKAQPRLLIQLHNHKFSRSHQRGRAGLAVQSVQSWAGTLVLQQMNNSAD